MTVLGNRWPIVATITFPLVLVILEASSLGLNFAAVMIGIPVLSLLWIGLAGLALLYTARLLRERSWWRAARTAVLPIAVLSVAFHLSAFVRVCNHAGDALHFVLMRPAYVHEISQMPQNGHPRLVVFNRGGMSWASRGYVYDESDEVVLDASLQTADWKLRAQETELSCGYSAAPLASNFGFAQHWYVASFSC